MLTYTLFVRRVFVAFVAVLAATLAAPAWASQQDRSAAPMADRLPEDVVLYIGWVGSDRIAELWDGTHTQALVQASNFEDFFARYVPEVLDKVAEMHPEAAQPVGFVQHRQYGPSGGHQRVQLGLGEGGVGRHHGQPGPQRAHIGHDHGDAGRGR